MKKNLKVTKEEIKMRREQERQMQILSATSYMQNLCEKKNKKNKKNFFNFKFNNTNSPNLHQSLYITIYKKNNANTNNKNTSNFLPNISTNNNSNIYNNNYNQSISNGSTSLVNYINDTNNINTNTKYNNNLSSSQDSLNSLTETEDGEEEKEKQILSSYKLGICKIFEKEENIKSNIVKEMSDKFYKIYSQGEPESIKKLCKSDTLPEDYEKIILKNKEEGNEVLCLCGKKVKMSYLQCQRIERNKCESNMIFLGFVFYRRIEKGHNPGYS